MNEDHLPFIIYRDIRGVYLLSPVTYNKSICQKKEKQQYIYICGYSKDVHRTKCQALTIVRFNCYCVHLIGWLVLCLSDWLIGIAFIWLVIVVRWLVDGYCVHLIGWWLLVFSDWDWFCLIGWLVIVVIWLIIVVIWLVDWLLWSSDWLMVIGFVWLVALFSRWEKQESWSWRRSSTLNSSSSTAPRRLWLNGRDGHINPVV